MILRYESSPQSGALRQGELLGGVIEFKVKVSELSSRDDLFSDVYTPPSVRVNHPLVIVLSPDCDLEWDYQARTDPNEPRHKILDHVLLCDLYSTSEIRDAKDIKSKDRDRIKSHQNIRYHRLDAEDLDRALPNPSLPELYLDFKNPFALSVEYVMYLIDKDIAKRRGILPSDILHHMIQRYSSFNGRVSLP